MRRILALDGGGIRGVFSLEVLLQMQTLLRERYQRPKMVLADHFDLFAGTSTGAIIATCLCWGMDVETILKFYLDYGKQMFTPVPWYRPIKKLLISRYEARPLSEFLRRIFSEDGKGKVPALLDSPKLKKSLLVVVRNHSTGSAWPLTNNVHAMYNDPEADDCNLKVPLWKIVRASTAAPVYFDPERITIGGRSFVFVDGSVTPYNNPALIAALTALLPRYKMNWSAGPSELRVVSVGTLRFSSALPEKTKRLWLGYNAAKIPAALIEGVAWQQDYLCRCLGECLFGEPLDSEVGTLIGEPRPQRGWFSYVRYNKFFKGEMLAEILRESPELASLDALQAIPLLRKIGQEYARDQVRLDHFA